MKIQRFFRWAGLALGLCAGPALAESVAVAVASNFAAPMQKIAAAFARDTGHQAKISLGATGKFYAQINNGAPFEVLLSADASTPAKLAAQGQADAASQFTYAIGQLVLWSSRSSYVDAGAQVLHDTNWQHLAVANPKVAPYGAAAMQTLEHLGMRSQVQSKLVHGENIGQTFQFVASGNAQLGFVALSQVMQDRRMTSGSGWVVPSHMHAPIRQDAILLRTGADNPAALALMQYLRSDTARRIIQSYGYVF